MAASTYSPGQVMKSGPRVHAVVRHRDDFAPKQFVAAFARLRAEQERGGFQTVAWKKMAPQLVGDLLREHQRVFAASLPDLAAQGFIDESEVGCERIARRRPTAGGATSAETAGP